MLDAGEIINGRYRIEEVVGKGGMGAVYLATHLQLDEPVAVKELLPPTGNPDVIAICERQFRTEARILNRLRHPNLPRVYDFFELSKRLYIVMDFIKGGTLVQVVKQSGPVNEETALSWARQLSDVLKYLHHQDPPVIFRDLKPDNIMLEEDGTIRLIDFGIAKIFDAELGASTQTVLRAATHGFSAPEQYGEGGTDARSDVYSLGATLYAVLTKSIPPSAMLLSAGVEELEPLAQLRPDLSETTVAAIEWMMQVRQELRPAGMEEVQEALGLTTTAAGARATVPQQVRQLLREEFQQFFPAREWFDHHALLQRVLAIFDGGAPMAALTGEPGMGKSRLLEEAASRLGDVYTVMTPGIASQPARHQPFGVLQPCFSAWLRSHADRAQAELPLKHEVQELQEAAQVLPELNKLVADTAPMAKRGPLDRARSLMSVLMTLLELASEEAPVLLVLDDMQWADDPTLKLLDTLRLSTWEGRVAVLLAMDDLGQPSACADFIERWSRKGDLWALAMPPLSRGDVAPYLQAMLPKLSGLEPRIDDLLTATHGNPLALEELIRFLVVRRLIADRGGTLTVTDFKATILPHSLEDAVRRRREHLPLDTQRVLAQAAVVGKRFDLRTLLKLSGENTSVLADCLSAGCEGMFIMPDTRGSYRFVSEATRRVFYESQPMAQRAQMHRKLGTMEEERAQRTGDGAPAGYHYEQAGDVDKSLEYLSKLSHDMLELQAPRRIEVVVGDAIKLKGFKDTVALTPDQLKEGLKALAMLVRSMKGLEIYGPHSPITQTSFGTALNSIDSLVRARGTLGYSVSEEAFHINQSEVPMEQLPGEVKALLNRHRISGFEFQPGVQEQELREFVDLLMVAKENIQAQGGWTTVCKQHNITHIVVNETVYIGVAEKDLFDVAKLKAADEVVVKNTGTAVAEAPAVPVNVRPGLEGLDSLLSTLAVNAPAEAVIQRLDRLRELLQDMKVNRESSAPLAGPVAPVSTALLGEVPAQVDDLLRQARVDDILRLISLMNAVEIPLKTFLESRPELLLKGLEDPDPALRTLAAMGVMQMGKDARRWLVQYLRTSTHEVGRSVAIWLFARAEADPAMTMAREVLSSTDPEETVRLLQAMQLGDLPWAMPLATLMVSPVRPVRKGALQVLLDSGMPNVTKIELLQSTLQSEHLAVIGDAVSALGELQDEKAIPILTGLTRRRFYGATGEPIRILEQICHALGRIGSVKALPFLKSVLKKSLLSGAHDPVARAAAVMALRTLPGEEAKELIRKHTTDSETNVGYTARHLVVEDFKPTETQHYQTVVETLKTEGLPPQG